MSVLVFDDKTLAADSHINAQGVSIPFEKVWKVNDRTIAGAIGDVQAIGMFREWTKKGLEEGYILPIVAVPFQGLVVTKGKGIVRYNNTSIPLLHGFNSIAVGEGAPFAYGALDVLDRTAYTGNDKAQIAVEAAINYSPHCNGHAIRVSL